MAAAAVQSGVEKVLNKLSLGDSSDPPSVEQVQELRAKYAAVDQDHVFAFWDKLSNSEKASFFQQLSSINPERVQVCTCVHALSVSLDQFSAPTYTLSGI
jgi:UDP-N-acetylglucosamine/UDP-N-acetylgalactosamine diphosphorylase